MTTERKRISIYDYPEHLNPFSECHLNAPDKRKIFVNKLPFKNGTWSSKISKRINRSVSWIENSWLTVGDSPRRTNENRICNDLHNNALYTRQSETHNATRTESCSDVSHDALETSQHMHIPNGKSLEKAVSEENINKYDTRRRKKRPAPLPPNPSSPQHKQQTEAGSLAEIADKIGEIEENSQDNVSLEENIIINAEISESHTKLVDEVPSVTDNNAQSAPSEQKQILSQTNETELNEEIQNLRIELCDDNEVEQLKSNEHEISPVHINKTCENDEEPVKSDKNANIPTIKSENKINSQVHECKTEVQCNGKAVLIASDDS